MEAMTRQFSPNLLSQGRARLHVGDGTLIAPDKQESVLADQIANYNSSAGHINIDNPGALIVMSYIPFARFSTRNLPAASDVVDATVTPPWEIVMAASAIGALPARFTTVPFTPPQSLS